MHPIFFEKVNEAMFHFLVSRKKKKKRRITRRVTFWSRSLRINDPGRKIGGQIARELSLAGGIWSSLSPLVLVSRLFGESGGEEDLEKGFYCWRGGLLAFISGSVASQDPALVRRSSVLFASHLAAHFQFDAARAFRGLYSSTISQAYCLYPPFYSWGEFLGLPWLANYRQEMAAVRDPIIDPSSFQSSSSTLKSGNISLSFSIPFSRNNKYSRMLDVWNDLYFRRTKRGRTYRSKILAIQCRVMPVSEER